MQICSQKWAEDVLLHVLALRLLNTVDTYYGIYKAIILLAMDSKGMFYQIRKVLFEIIQ